MSYTIEYRASVRRDSERLPRDRQRRIDATIQSLAEDPRPPGCVKLAGHDNLYRIRVGDDRVVYEVSEAELRVIIVAVAHRRDVYRGL